MFTHLPPPKLPNIKSVEGPIGRFYQSPKTKMWYPSVTTVTGHAKQAFFTEWRKKPENMATMQKAASRGNSLHTIVEKYIQNNPKYQDHSDMLAKFMFEKLEPELKKIDNIHIQEQSLYSDYLRMAGRVDCIGEYKGKLSIIDFKGSGKPKKEEWITNYFEQASCYSLMYQELLGINVDSIVILMVSEDGTVQVFEKPVRKYLTGLKETMKLYWAQNNFDQIQETMKEYA